MRKPRAAFAGRHRQGNCEPAFQPEPGNLAERRADLIDFGGNFLSNFLSVSVDYQTVFLPFLQSPNGQFKQVMVLGLHFQLPHGMQFNMDTNVTPLGQIRYTAYGSTYAYHGMGPESSGTSFTGKFYRNVCAGKCSTPMESPWRARRCR